MTDSLALVRAGFLSSGLPSVLVDELLEAFAEAKRRFYLGDFRPSAVEGGRFSEAAFRILEWAAFAGTYTELGDKSFKTEQLIEKLRQLPGTAADPSVRLHIPRTLRLIYDIRNTRDTAHLAAPTINPNLQDATLVVNNMDWVLAELVRLYHNVSADKAHKIIDTLVTRDVPVVQEINGFPVMLKNLPAGDHALVLLYGLGGDGLTKKQLSDWVRPAMRGHLTRTLGLLEKKLLVHFDSATDTYYLTRNGQRDVEARRLIEPAN